jgi:ABC-type glycerol-3-phosphate transport system substrate-binding protein
MTIFRVLFVAAAMCLPLAACGGGGAKTETSVTNTTVSKGQRLIDLKAALDAGAINEKEYQKERQAILDE